MLIEFIGLLLASVLGVICNAGSCASIVGVICNAGLCVINNWCNGGADFMLFNSNASIDLEINFNFATMSSSSYADTFLAFCDECLEM